MENGWVKLYRKSLESQVFTNDYLWKLWCLCLLKANHKTEYVPIDGIVEPVKVEPGQFITGRYELHADYHQRRRGYKKRFPSPFTVWRWLLSLRNMQNLSIKSFNKYSMISISNWELYQESEQQMSNRRATGEHKQEVFNIPKGILSPDSQAPISGGEEQTRSDSKGFNSSSKRKGEAEHDPVGGGSLGTGEKGKGSSSPKRRRKSPEPDPNAKPLILEHAGDWAQKFAKPYMITWGMEMKLMKRMLQVYSPQEIREARKEFFLSDDPYIQNSDYSIRIFYGQIKKLVKDRACDPVEQARREMAKLKETEG